MKKIILFTAFLLSFLISNAQSTEKFIRIIGNAKIDLKAEDAMVYFTIQEKPENSYNPQNGISLDTIHKNLIQAITDAGLNADGLEESYDNLNRYSRSKSQNFVYKTNISNLKKIYSINVEGANITKVSYLIPEIDTKIETQLSSDAIEDADRKAEALCKKIGQKRGKILNIEVKSSDLENRSKESVSPVETKNYRVSVTYKLED